MKGIGKIDGVIYETIGSVDVTTVLFAASGKVKTYMQSQGNKVKYSAMEIRNLGKYPVRFRSGKTLLPFEVWAIGMDGMRRLKETTFDYGHIKAVGTTPVPPLDNIAAGYQDDHVIEVNGIILETCECKKIC